MYDFSCAIETSASPEAIWRVYTDLPNWGEWNGYFKTAQLEGPFASGTRGRAQPLMSLTDAAFHLENVEPLARWDLVWGVKHLLNFRIDHHVERAGERTRVRHGYHFGGLAAPMEFGLAASWRLALPGKLERIAQLAGDPSPRRVE